MLRHAYAGGRRLTYSRLHIISPSTASTYKATEAKLHTSALASFSSPSASLLSEHNLNPTASPSSSRNDQSIPPPSPKKRVAPSRHAPNTQTRSAAKSSPSPESKRATPAKESSVNVSEPAKDISHTTFTQQTAHSTRSAPVPPPQGGKEPPKTIMQKIKGLWANLKYLFKFYYQGVKQIWFDRKIVAELRKKIAERESTGGEGIRWIEQAIIAQHKADLRKLPLFLAILLILEEILPLVVIYAPSLLPSTCVLPSQRTKMRSGDEAKRGLAVQSLVKNESIRGVVEDLASQLGGKGKEVLIEGKETEETMKVKSLTRYGSEVVGDVAKLFAVSSWGPSTMVSSRIEKHLINLQLDDEMLRYAYETRQETEQWNEIRHSDWLWKACAQRGLRAFEADEQTMERNLTAYLRLTSKSLTLAHRSLLPLTLYDGNLKDLLRLQGNAEKEASKGIKRRTLEVVEEVTEAEKKKEVKSQ
ncbi:hypothetical protein CBS101457_005278 [Exobasidium rhododendri]|nr:hypothetical protein CBS101457_005278 [Exobasidium rhododendri]